MTEATPVLVDILGQAIEPGDPVVYPQMSGRSVQIMRGELVSYNGKSAQVRRLQGTRWGGESEGETRYRDKRTGKGIDPYMTHKHHKVPPRSFYRHTTTGEEISEEEYRDRFPIQWSWSYSRSEDGRHEWRWQHDDGVLHDYVEEYVAPARPVTIQNVKNIVKVVSSE